MERFFKTSRGRTYILRPPSPSSGPVKRPQCFCEEGVGAWAHTQVSRPCDDWHGAPNGSLCTGVHTGKLLGSSPSKGSSCPIPADPEEGTTRPDTGSLPQGPFQCACNENEGNWGKHLLKTQPESKCTDSEFPNFNLLDFTGPKQPVHENDLWSLWYLPVELGGFYVLRRQTHPHSPHVTVTAHVPVGSHTESCPQCSHRCHPYKGEGYVHIRQCLKGKNVRAIKELWGKNVHAHSMGERFIIWGHCDSNMRHGLIRDGITLSSLYDQ